MIKFHWHTVRVAGISWCSYDEIILKYFNIAPWDCSMLERGGGMKIKTSIPLSNRKQSGQDGGRSPTLSHYVENVFLAALIINAVTLLSLAGVVPVR